MKSILHCAIESPSYSSAGITNAMKELFEEVTVFNWQHVKANETIIGMWERLIAKTHMEEPEILFLHIQSSGNLDADVLRSLPQKTFTVLYSFDVRQDIGWIKDLAPHLGLVVVPDYDTADELKKAGFSNVFVSHSSADYNLYNRADVKCQPAAPSIVFIGNNYENTSLDFPLAKQRREMVEFLQETYGNLFQPHGQGWRKNGKIVSTHDEINIYNCAQVAVTHNNFFRRGYSSDRLWRALGCGIATVSQYYHGIGIDFNKSVMRTWLNHDMLKEEIDKLLEDDEYRHSIAREGRKWARERHGWVHRFQEILNFIQKHKNELCQQPAAN